VVGNTPLASAMWAFVQQCGISYREHFCFFFDHEHNKVITPLGSKRYEGTANMMENIYRTISMRTKIPQGAKKNKLRLVGDRTRSLIHNKITLLIEAADDKIRKYRTDYKNNPPHCVSFIAPIPRTRVLVRLGGYIVNLSDF